MFAPSTAPMFLTVTAKATVAGLSRMTVCPACAVTSRFSARSVSSATTLTLLDAFSIVPPALLSPVTVNEWSADSCTVNSFSTVFSSPGLISRPDSITPSTLSVICMPV